MAFLGWISSQDGVDLGPGLARPSSWGRLPSQSLSNVTLPIGLGDYVRLPDMSSSGGYGAEALWANASISLLIAGDDISIRADGTLISGTATIVSLADTNFSRGFFLADVALDVRLLERVGATQSTADDMRVLASALSGDDFIYVPQSDEAQNLAGFGGDDLIVGGAGVNRMSAGAGRDLVYGGASNDTLRGGLGADILVAEAGDDHIFGGSGADALGGRVGNDTLRGGAGADLFVFGNDFGRDRIVDFRDGVEVIALVGVSEMADIRIIRLTDGQSLVRVSGEGAIQVNVTAERLTATDFLFGEDARDVADRLLAGFFDHWDYG